MKKQLTHTGSLGTYFGAVIVHEAKVIKDQYNPSSHDTIPVRVTAWKVVGKAGGTVVSDETVEHESEVLACAMRTEEKIIQILKRLADPVPVNTVFALLSKHGYE